MVPQTEPEFDPDHLPNVMTVREYEKLDTRYWLPSMQVTAVNNPEVKVDWDLFRQGRPQEGVVYFPRWNGANEPDMRQIPPPGMALIGTPVVQPGKSSTSPPPMTWFPKPSMF